VFIQDGEPVTFEVSFDPGDFDSFHFRPMTCQAVRKEFGKDQVAHTILSPDGLGPEWDTLVETQRITRPHLSEEPGRFSSSHTPFCFHQDPCNQYCVCNP
jgi:hypothetical protein